MVFRLVASLLLSAPSVVFADVGFRDLKVGSDPSLIEKHCSQKEESKYQCYGIDDFVFDFSTQDDVEFHKKGEGIDTVKVGDEYSSVGKFCTKSDYYFYKCKGHSGLLTIAEKHGKVSWIRVPGQTINQIKVDIGPLYQTFLDKIVGDPNNPYIKLKKGLDSNYKMDWEFTERDRKLFNEGDKDSLWTSYNSGQVFSQIVRTNRRSDLRLFVYYHTKEDGLKLSKERAPNNGNFNNF